MLASFELRRNAGREHSRKVMWRNNRLREFAEKQETIYVGGLRRLDRS